ncbi:MAG: hypothetical protein H6636_04185 [Anaerolineales bacterium]|nr:hypothetical protein [Anaerolineales bacterium]
MKTNWKFWLIASLLALTTLIFLDARIQATATRSQAPYTYDVSAPAYPVLSVAVRDLPIIEEPYLARETNPIQWLGEGVGAEGTSVAYDALAPFSVNDGVAPDPLVTFEGVPSLSGVTPPDTNGDVGPNHYIQMTNFHFQIWDKGDPDNGIAPTPLTAPIAVGTLFTSLGGGCQNNYGDPVVLYDDLADRWVLTQFNLSGALGMCFAVSTTPDPLDTYYLYNIGTPDFPDYPKIGVWPDGYYMGTNTGFPNQYFAHVFDRVAMLNGQPATRQSVGSLANLMMPADVDGQTPPPDDAPGIFYTYYHPSGSGHPAGNPRLAIYEYDVDWANPGNSTYTLAAELLVTPFNYTVCGFFAGGCVPQPGTGQLLDDLSWWPMFRFQYRNFGQYEAMVGNFAVDLDNTNKAAIRWFEVRKTNGVYSLYQESTYAPDSSHRWMGSIAMDGSGNIALAYSVSNPSTGVDPSIRYATRLRNDPLGTLSAEAEMWTGTGVQTGIHRWGDYSDLTVDPVDNCTFWFTTEYHDVTDSGFGWNTRIGVFRIPECTGGLGPDFDVAVEPESMDACIFSDSPTVNVNVEWMQGYNAAVTLSAVDVPAGYNADFSINPLITPTVTSELTFLSTGAATAGTYPVNIVGLGTPTPTHTATLTLNLFNPITTVTTLLAPADGETGVSPAPSFSWDPVFGATSYGLDIATDAAFNDIVFSATGIEGTSYDLAIALGELHVYYWRIKANNACGDGSHSGSFSFTTKDVPSILLVDDDDNSPSVINYYTQALDDLSWVYDVWHTDGTDEEPTATDLAPYTAVIWFTGDNTNGKAGPGADSEAALGTWLDNTQGCFYLSSQDYFQDRGLTDFMTQYLGTDTITEGNGDYSQVIGQGVYSALGTRSLLYPFTDSADWIIPDGTAEVGIVGTNGRGAALTKEDGYKSSFWVFPLEAIYGSQNRRNALNAFINWCGLELPYNGLALSSDQAGTASAGTTFTYTLTVTNTGNVTDLYTLSLAGNTWSATLSTENLTIDGGASAEFTVVVTVPIDAMDGESDTVTVTVTSQSDNTLTASASLTTTASTASTGFSLYLPLLVK